MRVYLLTIILCVAVIQVNSQEYKISVINDTTELQEYESGEKIKVNYRLNGKILSLKEKDRILEEYPHIHRDFNIKTVDKELIGEVSFTLDLSDKKIQYNWVEEPVRPATIDITKKLWDVPFPGFSWMTLMGAKLSLDELRGKTVVLNFWHTSCIPCIAEMPLLNELVKKYEMKNVVFIASTPNTAKELTQFLSKKEFYYQQTGGVDPKNIFSPFPGWPIHVVLNGEGLIKFIALGKQKEIEQKLANKIDEALREEIGG